MNPLCTLRYSATHADKHHMVYPARRRGRLRAQAGQADRGGLGRRRGRPQQAVRAARLGRATSAGVITRQGRAGRADAPRRAARREVTVQDGDDLEQTTGRAVYAELPHRRNPRRKGQRVHGAARPGRRALPAARPGRRATWTRLAVQRADDPPHDQGASRQGEAPAPAGHQGAVSLFFIDAVEQLPPVRRRRQPGEGRVRADLRGGVPPARQAPRLPDACSRKWTSTPTRPRRSTTATSRSTRRAAGRTRRRTTRRNRDNAERAYNLIMKDKEKLLELRDAAEVHLLPLGAARGLGQPERLPDLHPARHPDQHHRGPGAGSERGRCGCDQVGDHQCHHRREQHRDRRDHRDAHDPEVVGEPAPQPPSHRDAEWDADDQRDRHDSGGLTRDRRGPDRGRSRVS